MHTKLLCSRASYSCRLSNTRKAPQAILCVATVVKARSLIDHLRYRCFVLNARQLNSRRIARCPQVVFSGPSKSAPSKTDQSSSRLYKLLAVFSLGLCVWVLPLPAGVTRKAWQLLSIFVATLAGIVLQPLPLGAVTVIALAVALLTNTLSVSAALAGFGTEVPHLILVALFLARVFGKTGLGQRLALSCVQRFGSNPIGLAYSLVFSEVCIAPAIPSVVARSGAIFLPLVKSLSEACGSSPADGTQDRVGTYLCFTLFQSSAVSSAMFLTANHPNPLAAAMVEAATGTTITWSTWAAAAAVPGLVSLLVLPLLMACLAPPTLKNSAAAQEEASRQLQAMGGVTRNEVIMALVMIGAVVLWVCGSIIGLSPLPVALAALVVLLCSGVCDWNQDCLANQSAWNTLVWFSVMLALAQSLRSLGLIDVLTGQLSRVVASLGLPWQPSFLLITLVYFYCHYFFASNLAHVSAMMAAFLGVAIAAGTPPLLAGLTLSFLSDMMGGLTHYGMSHGPMYYAEGYVSLGPWLRWGFIVSVANLLIWLLVGGAWWKLLGVW